MGGKVSIASASGKSFGEGSVVVTLQNQTLSSLSVVLRQGSIFQHVDWQHRQNLLVMMDYVILLPAEGSVTKQLHTYCMNLTCACSSGNPMSLTDFYFDDAAKLESQGLIWDHFENHFRELR